MSAIPRPRSVQIADDSFGRLEGSMALSQSHQSLEDLPGGRRSNTGSAASVKQVQTKVISVYAESAPSELTVDSSDSSDDDFAIPDYLDDAPSDKKAPSPIEHSPANDSRSLPAVRRGVKKPKVQPKVNSHNQKKVQVKVPETPKDQPTADPLAQTIGLGILSNHMRMKRLQDKLKNEITPHVPKYLQKKVDLENKLKEKSLGRNVELVGDEVWAQQHRWYQNPAYGPAGWHPAEATSGALIDQSKSLQLGRLKTPGDKRRVEQNSTQAIKNAEVTREATAEVALGPFRNSVFFDNSSKKSSNDCGRPSRSGSRGGRRANTTLSYYPPMNAQDLPADTPIDYKVPKALLSEEDRTRLGITLGSTKIRPPGLNKSDAREKISKSSTVLSKTPVLDASARAGSPMKFAKTTTNDGAIMPADVYRPPSQLLKRGLHHKCSPQCANCDEVNRELDTFEEIEREREDERRQEREAELAQQVELETSLRRKQTGLNDDDTVSRNKPISDGAASVMIKALDKMKKKSFARKPEPQPATKPVDKDSLDRHVTIAHLYFDMSHRDREDVYISVVGGLSFDLTRSKFASLMGHVLAPRIGVNLTDEQVHTMFSLFDINHGGTISYFEYLTALCHTLLSDQQTQFLTGVFNMLIAARQQAALQKQISSGKPVAPAGSLPTAAPGSPSANGRPSTVPKGPTLHSLNREAGSSSPSLVKKTSLTAGSFRRHARVGGENETGDPTLGSPSKARSPTSTGAPAQLPSKAKLKPVVEEPVDPLGANGKKISTLRKRHLTYERVRHTVFGYQGHSLMFPHPVEDRFSHLVSECFDDLKDTDELDLAKFKLLLFCDDQVIEALNEIFPKPVPFGLGHLVEGTDRVVASPPGSLNVSAKEPKKDGKSFRK